MKLWGTITGVLTSAAGLKKVWSVFKQVKKAKTVFSESKDLIKEGADLYEEYQKAEALYKKITADGTITPEEAKQAVDQLFNLIKELRELKDQYKKLRDIFK